MNGPVDIRLADKLFVAFSDVRLKERFCARLCSAYGRWLGGFRTLELRGGGKRGGFEIEVLGGGRAVLASTEMLSPVSFNKYALDLAVLERTALPALETAAADGRILLMDELGPMAMKSERFSARVVELLFSPFPCLAFFRRGATVFEDAVDRMEGAAVIELTGEGWAEAVRVAEAWLDRLASGTGRTK